MKKIIILIVFYVAQNSYSMDKEDYQALETFLEQEPLALLHNNNDSQDNIHELSDVPFDFEQFFNESNGDLSIENPTKKQKVELVCYDCSAFCNSQNELVEHLKECHPGIWHTDEKIYVCDHEECKKPFTTAKSLGRHKKDIHKDNIDELFDVPFDFEQYFNESNQLIRHVKIHTKERLYVCEHESCGKAFSQKSNLSNHKKIHTGERPHKCTYCGNAFVERHHLADHIRIHTGEKQHACKYEGCGKAFAQKSNLTVHNRIHTGEKPHVCKYEGCGKAFGRKFTLVKHYETHEKLN